MLGYTREELIGKTIVDLIPAEEVPRLARSREYLLAGGVEIDEWSLRHKDGYFLPVEVSTKMLPDGRWLAFVRDITDRRHAAEALAAERRWLQTVIERSPVGIVLSHDPTGARITAPRRAEELCGARLSPEGGITQYLGQLCGPDGVALDVDDLPTRRALRGETTTGRELLLRRHDGSAVPVLVSGAPIVEDRGQLLGAVVVYEDLTRIKDLERLREEWTSMVAHELRQPVTTILGYATLLARRSEGPDRARADHILASALRLDRMIGDLLDASSIEARRLAITRRPTDLGALLRSVAERCAAEARGHPVEVEIRGATPSVDVDAGRIEQVLTNLISNAAKYGYPDTEVRVLLEQRAREV
jgi:PAS domain S-box-containing protein